ncbi:MAG: hypothetical protein QM764_08960 [Chitinophagaceae bacterium]
MNCCAVFTYIPKRMSELGYSDNYSIRMRHLILQPGEKRKIDAESQLFILVEPPVCLKVESATGLFDLSEDQANELHYEHQGEIIITNYSMFSNHVRFIQVIPKLCNEPCR